MSEGSEEELLGTKMSLLKEGNTGKTHKCKTEEDMQVLGRNISFILDILLLICQPHPVEKI